MDVWIIAVLFLIIAVLYSSAGFGGGSGYLAILSLFTIPFIEMRFLALTCNIIVVSGSLIIFIRGGHIIWRKAAPLLIASVPMAFLGGSMPVEQRGFFMVLGLSLLLAALSMLFRPASAPGGFKSRTVIKRRNRCRYWFSHQDWSE